MTNPQIPERTDDGPYAPAERSLIGIVEHSLCGIAGLLCTGLVLALWYPALVTLTEPLYVLSSTALIAIAISVWLLTWLGVEFLREWRSARAVAEL